MKRPGWLDPRISFCKDTPDSLKGKTPVLLDIRSRDSQKLWKWEVEIDFYNRPDPSVGAWANIDHIAHCCCGEPIKCSSGPASRGSWCQYNFKSAKGALRFAQQSLLFVEAMEVAGIGLLPRTSNDPLSALFMEAQKAFHMLELRSRLGVEA